MNLDLRWVVAGTLIAIAAVFVTVSVSNRAATAARNASLAEARAALVAERELRDQALTLCRSTIVARKDGNQRNRALHDYLVTVLKINAKAEKLQPTPKILRPLVRKELAAARRLVRQLQPLPIPHCPTNHAKR